ncbi:40S ribosomal protein S5-1 [Hordeum vulgare]|nr:40S ribosomal protein S5-1 [Hordeum vulgare]
MREGMLHIRDVEGPKKTGSVETRLEAMEQQVFKCQGMVERGLNANHMMITGFTNKHRSDANDIGKHLSRLYDRIDQVQAQIYDLQNQNCLRVKFIVCDPSPPFSGDTVGTLDAATARRPIFHPSRITAAGVPVGKAAPDPRKVATRRIRLLAP